MKTTALVEAIFSEPTAPFREHRVLAKVKSILTHHRVPYFEDDYGNIVAGVNRSAELKSGLRVGVMAHTDHPGFHITKALSRQRYQGLWLGQALTTIMKTSQVRIFDPARPQGSFTGRIVKVHKRGQKDLGVDFEILLKKPQQLSMAAFGGFDFAPFKWKGPRLQARACDDLTGVVLGIALMLDLKPSARKNTFSVFTRGEEVGFIGCLRLLKDKVLSPRTWTISLEASKALPLAQIGKGPVLRLGDRSTLFDSQFSVALFKEAQRMASEDSKFHYQRRLMDGGTCEATALKAFGIPTTGLALPLLNYHNYGKTKPKPEAVDLRDLEAARELLKSFISNFDPNVDEASVTRLRLLKHLDVYSKYLDPK